MIGVSRTYFLSVSLFCAAACGEEYAAPFVAGFDRFVRHGQVEQDVGGRLLLSELSCTACHKTKADGLQPKRGPRLAGVGNRLQSDWLREFLASPQAAKPGTTMPDVLAGIPAGEKQRAIGSLLAFLSTQHESFPQLRASGANPLPHEFWKKGNVSTGRQLFHRIGCVACHQPDKHHESSPSSDSQLDRLLKQLEPEEIEEMGLAGLARPVQSVPHPDLAAKYTPKSLTFFLLNPEKTRPNGRMPNFKLQPVEAADIAAYLLRVQQGSPAVNYPDTNESRIREGRQLFAKFGCANCHAIDGKVSARQAKHLVELDVDATPNCLGAEQSQLPRYTLDKQQSEAIRTAFGGLKDSHESVRSSGSQIAFRMLQLNCFACHQRDELGGVGRNRRAYFETVEHIDLGDEGRLPPPLTGVGRKLRKPWLQKVLAGTGDLRPHMLARMPKYPGQPVADLPDLLIEADVTGQPSEKDVFGDHRGLADSGRLLLDVGCVQCHPIRGESLPGVAGVDLSAVTSRIQPVWFREFLLNPEQLKRGTRMPTFFPNGKSSNEKVLGGDVDMQIAAMWAYLKDIKNVQLPPKLVEARSKDFELVPSERPILLRTFMRHAGTHAIAVGFPQKVHFAFDAENVRLAQAWRGRFLDAYGTWFVRFTPPAIPLGKDQIVLPEGVPLAKLKDKQQRWPTGSAEAAEYQFRGYRIDRSGVPTFLYRWNGYEIEDRIEPSASQGLSRKIRINGLDNEKRKGKRIWFRVNLGNTLRQQKPYIYTNDDGLTTTVSETAADLVVVRKSGEHTEWIISIVVDDEVTIEVEYQW